MYDGIEYRGFAQSIVETLAENAGVPVWNGLTTEFHPTQMIADMLTVQEDFGQRPAMAASSPSWATPRNNIGNSLMVACAKLGMDFVRLRPQGPDDLPTRLVAQCLRAVAKESGATHHAAPRTWTRARPGASVHLHRHLGLHGRVQRPVGQSASSCSPRTSVDDNELMAKAGKTTRIFMHCLPSFHDRNTTIGEDIFQKFGLPELEVTDEVFESERSRVFDEAENRMHSIKAVMYATLKDPESE